MNSPKPFDVLYSIIQRQLGDISGGSERYVYGNGDLVVNADGFDSMCNRWNSSIVVDCFNVRNKSPAANHLKMIWENVTIKY